MSLQSQLLGSSDSEVIRGCLLMILSPGESLGVVKAQAENLLLLKKSKKIK